MSRPSRRVSLGPCLALVLLAQALVVAGCDGPEAEAQIETSPPPAEVRVAEAVGPDGGAGPVDARLWVPGTVVSRHDAEIAAEVAGPLRAVAEVGDTVEAGDVLAQVDDGALRLRLRSDEAEISRLEAQVEYLERQLDRIDALSREQIASRTQLDELTSQRAMAEQALESARVARDTTTFLLERSSLRAPFPGRVVARLAQPGSYVSVGEAVVRLVDTAHVEVRAQAPLASAGRVREGMELALEGPGPDGPVRVPGTVRAAVPVGDERSRMFELRLVPSTVPPAFEGGAEGPGSWSVGVPVRVALPASDGSAVPSRRSGSELAVSVPRDALVLRRDATYVFVATADGTARRVQVVPGAGDGERIEVTGALSHGDQVIVRGAERLEDGARIRIVD